MLEVTNQIIGVYLRCLAGDHPKSWLLWAEYCYNTFFSDNTQDDTVQSGVRPRPAVPTRGQQGAGSGLLGSSARSPNRESELRTKVKTNRDKSHNEKLHCGLPQMFQPVQRWVGGIYTPNLISSFLKCPSGPHEGQEITSGVFGNFPRLDSPT